jgi:predicted enzyme related to lactoylglutathione lyase
MIRLDHLTLHVSSYVNSRDWYVANFGLRVEFESIDAGVGGLEDDGGVELILVQRELASHDRDCALTFQVESVDGKYRELATKGVTFVHAPKHVPWGYGAELKDPDGYRVMLWDRATMPGAK